MTFVFGSMRTGIAGAFRVHPASLMGHLTPSIDELSAIQFEMAEVTALDGDSTVVITALRDANGMILRVTGVQEELLLSTSDLHLLAEGRRRGEDPGDPRRRDDTRLPVQNKMLSNAAFQAVTRMSTPMFLGLDRRSAVVEGGRDDLMTDQRRREFMIRRENEIVHGAVSTGIADLDLLLHETMSEIRRKQEQLDEKLRNQFLLSAFRYTHTEAVNLGDRGASRKSVETYRNKQSQVAQAAAGLRLPVEDVQATLNDFFEKMNALMDRLEGQAKVEPKGTRPAKRAKAKKLTESPDPKALFEWIVNKAQADRILENLELLSRYNDERTLLRKPVDRFLDLVNGFLLQTKKSIVLSPRGTLEVALSDEIRRGLNTLSSGERQIVVMLAHLALNKRLVGSGVFIVDEPELSLHLNWQEKFVDAIRDANPDVQIVLATHSPAIILDRDDHCRSLS